MELRKKLGATFSGRRIAPIMGTSWIMLGVLFYIVFAVLAQKNYCEGKALREQSATWFNGCRGDDRFDANGFYIGDS